LPKCGIPLCCSTRASSPLFARRMHSGVLVKVRRPPSNRSRRALSLGEILRTLGSGKCEIPCALCNPSSQSRLPQGFGCGEGRQPPFVDRDI
jgi:hypothetical protein